MALTLNFKKVKQVITDLTCLHPKKHHKLVGQGWVRINSKKFELQNKYVCRCGKVIFKPIGE
jgi:hypothetical protein